MALSYKQFVVMLFLGLAMGVEAQMPPPALPPEPPPQRSEKESKGPAKPVGLWKRDVAGVCQITFRVEDNRLFATCRLTKEDEVSVIEIEGDYSVTKDSVLYGVVTSVEVKAADSKPEELLETRANANKFIDQPFSLRFRVDDGVLTVKDLKFGGIGLRNAETRDREYEILAVMVGRYSQGTPPGRTTRNPPGPH